MDVNEYLCERIVRDRLNEARARAATEALLEVEGPRRRPIRQFVGHAFVRFGRWVLAEGSELESSSSRLTTLPHG
jgi:hypothetical protein